MAEDSLPRRARDVRGRLLEQRRKSREAHEVFMKEHEERHEAFIEVFKRMAAADDVDVEAVKRMVRENDEKTHEQLRYIDERDAEIDTLFKDLDMVRVEASIEGTKLRFDAIKQQATFSAAAVAGVTAVTESILPEQLRWTWLLWTSLIALLLTIVVSLLLLYLESAVLETVLGRGEELPEKTLGIRIMGALYFSGFGLPVAVIAYLVFALGNLG